MDNHHIAGKRQLVAVIAFIALSFVISFVLKSTNDPVGKKTAQDRALLVETIDVSTTPYRISFSTTGTVEARKEITIVPEVTGRVIKANDNFFAGGLFKNNELLFVIDPRDFRLEVKRLEAEVARAKTGLDLERAESRAALAEWMQINGDTPAPDLVARKPQMAEATALLKAAQAQLDNAKLDLERTRFIFPFNGRVISSDISAGQYVVSGQSYGRVFNMDSLEIRSSLKDKQLEWLLNTPDPKITITASYLGKKRSYKGLLKRAASTLDTNTRFAAVRFGFAEKVEDLLPGVFTNISITGQEMADIMRLPSQALQQENKIWLLNDDNTLSSIEPDIIYANDSYIAIRGMTGTKRVVISHVSGGTEGMHALIADNKNKENKAKNAAK